MMECDKIDPSTIIEPNDIVRHKQTGEPLIVCGVDYDSGTFVPCGYPFPQILNCSDCVIEEKRYLYSVGQPIEYAQALAMDGLLKFVERRLRDCV